MNWGSLLGRMWPLAIVGALVGAVVYAAPAPERTTTSMVQAVPFEDAAAQEGPTPAFREERWYQQAGLPVVVAYRLVCSLAGDDAAGAGIQWLDAASSVEVDGRSFWLFGDSFLSEGAGSQSYLPAPVAISNDADASDCVEMTFKTSDGSAEPLFPLQEGETTAWPDGSISLEPGYASFYFASVTRKSSNEWHVDHVGMGRFDTADMNGERVVEKIWDANSGFGAAVNGARSPVQLEGYVYVFLHTSDNRHLLARAPGDVVEDAAAYSYWDGVQWSGEPGAAAALWDEPQSRLPRHNGLSVRYNEFLDKWLAIYNGDLSSLRVRTADALTGPWSPELQWLDCSRIFRDVWPLCYSAEQNSQLAADGGRTLYVTLSSTHPYAAWLVELRLGAAIHEWRGAGGGPTYAPTSPGDGYIDAGAAFYAADVPMPGFSAIYRWDSEGERLYSAAPPGPDFARGEAAFYAPLSARVPGSRVPYDPVYRWDRGESHVYSPAPTGLEPLGYDRGPVAFYAVCGDADLDRVSDCLQ